MGVPRLLVVQDQRMLKLLMARDLYLNMDLLPLPLHSLPVLLLVGRVEIKLTRRPPATFASAGSTETREGIKRNK